MNREAQQQAPVTDGCQFWLPMKKRCCGWKCKGGERYCGNHLFAVTGGGEERVPCPANPKHDVPVSQLKAHLKKCPEAIKAAEARAQPYFFENLNAGADLNRQQPGTHPASAAITVQPATQDPAAAAAIAADACASFLKGTAEQRTAAAIALGPEWFHQLVRKVDAAHAALTAAYPLNRQLLGGCEGNLQDLFNFSRQLDPLMPFDKKHAAQHASIVGNMEAAGLLSDPQDSIFVELGAGKGFLSAWVHQMCGARELILLDRQGNFIKKADRRLRHTRLTRVAVDLKDAALVPLMQLHLRGSPPVTAQQREHQQRLARVHKQSQQVHLQHLQQKQQIQQDPLEGDVQQEVSQQNGSAEAAGSHAGDGQQLCNGSVGAALNSDDAPMGQLSDKAPLVAASSNKWLKNTSYGGLICCPAEPRSSLPQPQDGDSSLQAQQQMAWVAHGKHLCGAATDFALRACYNAVKVEGIANQQNSSGMGANDSCSSTGHNGTRFCLRGLAIATCCHHRCGWTAYCGREVLQQHGISRTEFETISWLTSWALCGHDASPGAEDGCLHGTADQPQLQPQQPSMVKGCQAGSAARVEPQQQHQGAYHPTDLLDRLSRIALGLKCKQVLDAGRCAWLQQKLLPSVQEQYSQLQGTATGPERQVAVQRVAYIDQSVTGENTLLLLGRTS